MTAALSGFPNTNGSSCFSGRIPIFSIGFADQTPRLSATIHLTENQLSDVVTSLGKFPSMQSVYAGSIDGVYEVTPQGMASEAHILPLS